ncbi:MULTISPECIES: polysaccharide deacetylase family protein [Spirulina sp. CCY15215]|uniref:polysaccharide deacetylase family protein n=1 Tax=Spirulina sp. CCY15215 TaxID=2767591 RepID=UPI00194F7064
MNIYPNFLGNNTVTIFLFHGIIKKNKHHIRNYTQKHILVDRFYTILKELQKVGGHPVSMTDIITAMKGKTQLPKRAFAITFDDGFENNYSVAAPVLEDLKIPATFYITTGFIENNTGSWIDSIEYGVEKVSGFHLRSKLLELNGYYETKSEKIELLNQIRKIVKNDSQIDPYEFADCILDQLGIKSIELDPDLDQKLNWHQIKLMASNELFTIGGHGHTHRVLAYLEEPELKNEIVTSLEKLNFHLNTPIQHYSYPEGLSHCYSQKTITFLKEEGIICSPSAEPGVNSIGDDLFHLKRIMVI